MGYFIKIAIGVETQTRHTAHGDFMTSLLDQKLEHFQVKTASIYPYTTWKVEGATSMY